jgi:hypothetical protein
MSIFQGILIDQQCIDDGIIEQINLFGTSSMSKIAE